MPRGRLKTLGWPWRYVSRSKASTATKPRKQAIAKPPRGTPNDGNFAHLSSGNILYDPGVELFVGNAVESWSLWDWIDRTGNPTFMLPNFGGSAPISLPQPVSPIPPGVPVPPTPPSPDDPPGTPTTAPPPPASTGWPDSFMSYPGSNPISLNGESGVVIENLSFENIYRSQGSRPITLSNCNDITIRRIDSRGCTMGLVYAQNCTNLTIEYCRAENIAKEFAGQTLGVDFSNQNDCNFYQLNTCDGITVRYLKGRYGNTEDVFSLYKSDNATVDDVHWQGGTSVNQPTSNGAQSVMWTSASGTGQILGDGGGSDHIVRDSTFLDAGQVPLQIAGGNNNGFDGCVSYGTGYTTQPWNVGVATWSNPTNMFYTDTRVWYQKGNGNESHKWWVGADPTITGSVFGDTTLNREDYEVSL